MSQQQFYIISPNKSNAVSHNIYLMPNYIQFMLTSHLTSVLPLRFDLTHWGWEKWTPFRRRHFQMHFLNKNVWIPIKVSLEFVPKGPINNMLALVQIMAWRRPGDKPLSEPMTVSLPTHICVARPQWVEYQCLLSSWKHANDIWISVWNYHERNTYSQYMYID